MLNDIEISKIFSKYTKTAILRRRINLIKKYERNRLIIPTDDSLLQILLEHQDHLQDTLDNLSLEEADNLQDFIKNTKLRHAIRHLNSRQKQILFLRYIKRYTLAEIGTLLGNVSSQAISQQVSIIIKKMHT